MGKGGLNLTGRRVSLIKKNKVVKKKGPWEKPEIRPPEMKT